MNCPLCIKGTLRVTHTFPAVPGTLTQRRKCLNCGEVFTAICTAHHKESSKGAGSAARMIRNRKAQSPPDQADKV